ncbi:hypothetical protein GCM10010413_15180 [Promicromonospora sukumoe]
MVRVWDLTTGTQTNELTGHTGWVNAVITTPDGRQAITAGLDGSVRFWDLTTGTQTTEIIGDFSVRAVAVTPDGRHVITASDDDAVRVWDPTFGTQAAKLTGHTSRVNAVVVTPDGREAITAGMDGSVRVWDLDTATQTAELTGHTGSVNAVAVTPDGRFAITAGDDRAVRVWDLDTATQTAELTGHTSRVNAVTVTPDGRHAITAGDNDAVRMWDLDTATQTAELTGHTSRVNAVTVTPDGRHAITGGNDRAVRVWDLVTGTQSTELTGHTGWVNAVAVTPDGRHAITAGNNDAVRIWDLATGTQTTQLTGLFRWVNAVALTPDGRLAITGERDGAVRVWDLTTGTQTTQLIGHAHDVNAIAVTPDGRHAISAGIGHGVWVWDLTTGTQTARITGHTGPVNAVTVTPDGRHVVIAGSDAIVRIWDLTTATQTAQLTGHTGWVNAVAVTPDGRRAITVADDATVRVWDLASGRLLHVLRGHWGAVLDVAIIPTSDQAGQEAISVGVDGTIRVWDVNQGVQVRGTFDPGIINVLHAAVLSDDASSRDALGLDSHVDAIGRLIAARSTQPPLAIALLAPWGGGKSTFLRLLDRHVTQAHQGDAAFVQHPRVVTFNVWHYSDTSVLVGLATQVVRTLRGDDKVPPDGPTETSGTTDSDILGRRVRDATLEAARLSRLRAGLNTERPRTVKEAIAWAHAQARILRLLPGVLRQGGPVPVLLVVASLGIAALAIGVATVLTLNAPGFIAWAQDRVSGVATIWTSLGWVTVVSALVVSAARALSKLVRTWPRVAASWSRLRRLVLDSLAEREQELVAVVSTARAADFVARLADHLHDPQRLEKLDKHRGAAGAVQDELTELARLLERAHEQRDALPEEQRKDLDAVYTDRIILHLDDLDRCKPDRVVEVLHAVALLQSIPLFIVIVSVDPRWLRRSVEQHNNEIFRLAEVHEQLGSVVGDPLSFLDKIFQIPYALPKLTPEIAGDYLLRTAADGNLVDRALLDLQTVTETPLPPKEGKTASNEDPTDRATLQAVPAPTDTPGTSGNEFDDVRLSEPHLIDPGTLEAVTRERRANTLRLTNHEARYLAVVAQAATTPRAVKKILNLYQLLRLGRHVAGHETFDRERTGGYLSAGLLLGLLVAAPAQAARIFRALDDSQAGMPLPALLTNVRAEHALVRHEHCPECSIWDRLTMMTDNALQAGAPAASDGYQDWLKEVARLSFHTEYLWNDDDAAVR